MFSNLFRPAACAPSAAPCRPGTLSTVVSVLRPLLGTGQLRRLYLGSNALSGPLAPACDLLAAPGLEVLWMDANVLEVGGWGLGGWGSVLQTQQMSKTQNQSVEMVLASRGVKDKELLQGVGLEGVGAYVRSLARRGMRWMGLSASYGVVPCVAAHLR